MCGIFGIIAKEKNYKRKELLGILEDIAKLSQVRGKDSSGLAYRFESTKTIKVLKGPVSIDELLRTREYKNLKDDILNEVKDQIKEKTGNDVFAALGHARLVTNGSQLEDENNQPVIKDGIVGIHNGIIVNENEIWNTYKELHREFVIDTEIIFSLFRYKLNKNGNSIEAMRQTNEELFGTVSTGFIISDRNEFIVFTNNGSLYLLSNFDDIFIYGSEKNILTNLVKKNSDFFKDNFTIKQVKANDGYIIDLNEFLIQRFNTTITNINTRNRKSSDNYIINVNNYHPTRQQLEVVINPEVFRDSIIANKERKLLEFNIDRINLLKRCSKCLLPETFPFITYDEKGVCNYCHNYIPKNHPRPIDELMALVEPYRRKDGQPDCIVPFSGGRDSTFVLHIVKNELKLNPIAFTYDWGMVTDLARRNIARVTGTLGVENIIVSANIHWKRENIKRNICAWLKNPELGMVPLFMAGDKFFFYYVNKLRKQTGIKLQLWGFNRLENTDFKVGFAGITPKFEKKTIYSMKLLDQLKLFFYVGKNIIKCPSYLNRSVFDSLGSFISRYLNPQTDYYHLFDYYHWDEKTIENLLFSEYKWETAIDTKSTWRIGDGTASFYNYIYYTVAGFSEFDTFRSNQIREGMLTREEALKLINEENQPRYESIKWYLEILGLSFENVIERINKIPKLYQ